MKTRIILILLSVLLSFSIFAGDFKKTSSSMILEDGDTVVFIGNSITHQCLYTQYIEDYFYTRYPGKRIVFHNAGVSGDLAADVLRRFDEDVVLFHPKYTSVLIGMNDGKYQSFNHEIFNTYKKDMSLLLDKLDTLGTIPILITPTMYDLRPALMGNNWIESETADTIHYNATMAFFGAWVLQTANKRGLGFVNMYEPLNRITRQNRKENPKFTLIEDSVHPGPDGQMVMALAFLRDVEADQIVSTIHLAMYNENWKVLDTVNGKLEKLSDHQIRFRFTSEKLPWVVPEEAVQGYKLTDAGHKMSREIIRVTGLKPGKYILKIDKKTVGTYSYLQLSQGVGLQENSLTPQYQQALKIAILNKKRNDEAVRPMRDLWEARKVIWKFNNAPDDFDDANEKEETRKELIKYFGSVDLKLFLMQFNSKLPVLHKKAKTIEDEIYRLNQPVEHTYEIVEE